MATESLRPLGTRFALAGQRQLILPSQVLLGLRLANSGKPALSKREGGFRKGLTNVGRAG
jgi:hypothetical protein